VHAWLGLIAEQVPSLTQALVLRVEGGGAGIVPIASYPEGSRMAERLVPLLQMVLDQQAPQIETPDDRETLIGFPLQYRGELIGIAALSFASVDVMVQQQVLRQLHWGSGWLLAFMGQQATPDAEAVSHRLSVLTELIVSVLACDNPQSLAMRAVGVLSNASGADRVSISRLVEARSTMLAVSNNARFEAGSALVRRIENAMDETTDLDQLVHLDSAAFADADVKARFPAHNSLRDGVEEVADKADLISAPLIFEGDVVGAIMLESYDGQGFGEEVEQLVQAVAYLLGPMFDAADRQSRSLWQHLKDDLAARLEFLFGPQRTLWRATGALVLSLLLFISFVPLQWELTAPATLEGAKLQLATVPQAGILREAPFRAGDRVKQGDVLAKLDQRELTLDRLRLVADLAKVQQQQREALAAADRTQAQIETARLNQAQAELAIVDQRLEMTEIRAPFDGILVAGDWTQKLGSPVERGDTLFEIAPKDDLQLVLSVDERDIAYVASAQDGQAKFQSFPDEIFPLAVTRVTPIAAVAEGVNAYRVEADLLGLDEDSDSMNKLRPGMKGVARIAVGRRSLMANWTRRFTEWLRITLWEFLP